MTERPNVLWIMGDQLRYDYLGCYSHPHLETPHLDAFPARGVQFDNACVQSPVCGPWPMSAHAPLEQPDVRVAKLGHVKGN
ncbi:MAG: sulfatase-like hydrolase/transferase, partial [Granulosicoccus sp.]